MLLLTSHAGSFCISQARHRLPVVRKSQLPGNPRPPRPRTRKPRLIHASESEPPRSRCDARPSAGSDRRRALRRHAESATGSRTPPPVQPERLQRQLRQWPYRQATAAKNGHANGTLRNGNGSHHKQRPCSHGSNGSKLRTPSPGEHGRRPRTARPTAQRAGLEHAEALHGSSRKASGK
jgi:hypothetical protein